MKETADHRARLAGRARGAEAEEPDPDRPDYCSIPVLLLPEGVLLEGLDASILLAGFPPEPPAPRGFLGRIAAVFGETWHTQWDC